MREVRDAAAWHEYVLDAPLGADPEVIDAARAKPGSHKDDVLDVCGVSVKAGYQNGRGARFFGKLVKLEGGEAVVVSTIDKETLWLGTSEQYFRMWCVD